MIPDNVFIRNIEEIGEEDYRSAYFIMPEDRRQLCDRFRHEDDKKRCIAADMLVREVLKYKYGLSEKEIIICRRENGKPYIKNSNIKFNISHCENIVAAVFSDREVGIDIEKIRPIKLAVMRKFCSMADVQYILGEKVQTADTEFDPDMLKRFFEVWTFKEAYFKATGEGLTEKMLFVDYNATDKRMFYFDDFVGCVVEKKKILDV